MVNITLKEIVFFKVTIYTDANLSSSILNPYSNKELHTTQDIIFNINPNDLNPIDVFISEEELNIFNDVIIYSTIFK